MRDITKFEDIRPYNDSEYKEAIKVLFDKEQLMILLQQYVPELSVQELKDELYSYNSIQEFQSKMICRIIEASLNKSAKEFSNNGVELIDKSVSQLLITNHRDIVLDSALVNYCLDMNGNNTCEIAIGSNLLKEPWVKRLVRINKSFIVKRNIPKQEMFEASKNLSAYIDYTIKEKKQSIWIAQREGRAKDGFDKTAPGLLKMFGMVSDGHILDQLMSLNITPVSISYELDPCDGFKLAELVAKAEGREYIKAEGEDEMSMALGIQGEKGNVHLEFGACINDKIEGLTDIKNRNQLLKAIAEIIDNEIYLNYKLWNSNYVAYDLLHDTNKYEANYSIGGKEEFTAYMNKRLAKFEGHELAKDIFLKMYANPVINAEKAKEVLV